MAKILVEIPDKSRIEKVIETARSVMAHVDGFVVPRSYLSSRTINPIRVEKALQPTETHHTRRLIVWDAGLCGLPDKVAKKLKALIGRGCSCLTLYGQPGDGKTIKQALITAQEFNGDRQIRLAVIASPSWLPYPGNWNEARAIGEAAIGAGAEILIYTAGEAIKAQRLFPTTKIWGVGVQTPWTSSSYLPTLGPEDAMFLDAVIDRSLWRAGTNPEAWSRAARLLQADFELL